MKHIMRYKSLLELYSNYMPIFNYKYKIDVFIKIYYDDILLISIINRSNCR